MQCPQCHNEAPVSDAQYGALYTCPRCMGVYFINFEGLPEYGDMTSSEPPASTEMPLEMIENIESIPAAEIFSPFAQAAQEIISYGNQEEVVSQLSYDVLIKGLDTKEVRSAFKEAIEDSKFGWVVEDIMNQIRNGESHLKNLNPVQAFVLATRIEFLDIDIEWKQNVAF